MRACRRVGVVFVLVWGLASRGMAGLWEELAPEEQALVLEQLQRELPRLLPPEDPRAVVQGLRAVAAHDIANLATLAGEVSAGQVDNAADQVLRWGGERLRGALQEELEARLQALDSPAAEWAYGVVTADLDLTREVARDLLSGRWEVVGSKLLARAGDEARSWIQSTTEARLKGAFNWVFGDRTIAGATPADIFLYLVWAEVELIPKLASRAEMDKLESLFQRYRDWGRDFSALEDSGGAGMGFGRSGGFGWWGHDLADLRELFESCVGDRIEPCVQRRNEIAQAAARRDRQALTRAIEEAGRREAEALKERLRAVAAERDRLARERSTEFAESWRQATALVKTIETAAGGVATACQSFDAAADRLEQASTAVREAEAAAQQAEWIQQLVTACRRGAEDLAGLRGDVAVLAQNAVERAIADLETESQALCAATAELRGVGSRVPGTGILDRATEHGRRLAAAAEAVEAAFSRARGTAAEIRAAAGHVRRELEQARERAPDEAALATLQTTIAAATGGRETFAAARHEMEQAAARAAALAHHVETANPIDLSWSAWLLEQLPSGTPNRVENTRIFQLLWPYRGAAEVDSLLAATRSRLETLRPPSCVRRWEALASRRWREPELPATLTQDLEGARRGCDHSVLHDLDELVGQVEARLAEVESREVAVWVWQRDGERCLAEAIEAFGRLPEADAGLVGEVAELERLCNEARAATTAAGAAATDANGALERVSPPSRSPAAIAEALAGCSRLDAQRAAVVRAAATVSAQVGQARAAAAEAAAELDRCADSAGLAAAVAAEQRARTAAREAAEALALAGYEDDVFDRIVVAARAAADSARAEHEGALAAERHWSAASDRVAAWRSAHEQAGTVVRHCRERQAAVHARWREAGSPAELAARVEASADEPSEAALEVRLADLGTVVRASVSAAAEAQAQLDACGNSPSAYAELLEAQGSMLALEPVLATLAGLEGRHRLCRDRVAGTSPERPSRSGAETYDPREDRDRMQRPRSREPREVDVGAVDGETVAGRIRDPGPAAVGGELPPLGPVPVRDAPSDDGFEKPPAPEPAAQQEDGEVLPASREPVRATDPDIVAQGTTPAIGGGRPPARSPDPPNGGRPEPPGPAGDGGRDGGRAQPPEGAGPSPGRTDDPPGGRPPAPGSEPNDQACERAAARVMPWASRYQAALAAHTNTEDDDCSWVTGLMEEAQSIVAALERDCRQAVPGREVLDQAVRALRAQCGGGSASTRHSVTLRNSGVDNIHICISCTGSDFTAANRIGPGGSGRVEVELAAGQSSAGVRFVAGRNRTVTAIVTCTVARGGDTQVRYRETSRDSGHSLSCE